MLEQFQTAYEAQRWLRYTTCIATLTASALLFWAAGGFPPQAWRFLAQTAPRIPELWALKGPVILLPLTGLVTLALTLLVIWGLLAVVISWMLIQHWRYLHERRQFEASVQSAQDLAAHDIEYEQWWQMQTEPVPQVATEARNAVHLHASAPLVAPQPAAVGAAAPVESAPRARAEVYTPPHAFHLTVGTALDPGIKRKNKPNEDRLLAFQGTLASGTEACPFGLFVIADGMGGHANGQEASRLAIHHIRETVIPALVSNIEMNDEDTTALLLDGVQQANMALYQHNQMYSTDIGATLTAALIVGQVISIANLGDSRTYLFSKDRGLTKVTSDHSVVARLVECGDITPDEVYTHPRRNEIYRCLGEKALADVDTFPLPLKAQTTLLLCSDGLWEMVRDPHIESVLRGTLPRASQASQSLLQAALDGGGLDNISVIVVHIS